MVGGLLLDCEALEILCGHRTPICSTRVRGDREASGIFVVCGVGVFAERSWSNELRS